MSATREKAGISVWVSIHKKDSWILTGNYIYGWVNYSEVYQVLLLLFTRLLSRRFICSFLCSYEGYFLSMTTKIT